MYIIFTCYKKKQNIIVLKLTEEVDPSVQLKHSIESQIQQQTNWSFVENGEHVKRENSRHIQQELGP